VNYLNDEPVVSEQPEVVDLIAADVAGALAAAVADEEDQRGEFEL
jgi:hypothetical protein